MSAPLRAGIVGGGFMAEVHARSVRAARGVVAAVASSSPERSAQAADRIGAQRALTVEQLVADPDVDVVHVCTPNDSHVPVALAALAAGKHVVCEKPIATTVEDAERLLDAARTAGTVHAVPFVYRFHPLVREVRDRLAADGRVVTVLGSYSQDWLSDPADDNWRVDAAAGGASRAFADIGSHLVDLVEFTTRQRVVRLRAHTRTVHPERGGHAVTTEDVVAAVVELDGGGVGTLLVTQVAPGRKNALVLEVAGGSETYRFEQENPEAVWIGRRAGSQLLQRDPAQLGPDAQRLSIVPSGHPLGYQNAFDAFVADVHAAVRGEAPEGLPTFDDGVRAARVTAAVLESARSGVDATP